MLKRGDNREAGKRDRNFVLKVLSTVLAEWLVLSPPERPY